MAQRKHVVLVADADQTVTVTGSGVLLITNHGVTATSVGDAVYVNLNAAATVRGDDMVAVTCGRPRAMLSTDKDGSIDVHLICHTANQVSVELVDPQLVEYAV